MPIIRTSHGCCISRTCHWVLPNAWHGWTLTSATADQSVYTQRSWCSSLLPMFHRLHHSQYIAVELSRYVLIYKKKKTTTLAIVIFVIVIKDQHQSTLHKLIDAPSSLANVTSCRCWAFQISLCCKSIGFVPYNPFLPGTALIFKPKHFWRCCSICSCIFY